MKSPTAESKQADNASGGKKRRRKRKLGRKLRKNGRNIRLRKDRTTESDPDLNPYNDHGEAHIEQITENFGSQYVDRIDLDLVDLDSEDFLAELRKMTSDLELMEDQLSLPSEHEIGGIEVVAEAPRTVKAQYEVRGQEESGDEEAVTKAEAEAANNLLNKLPIEYHPAILNYGVGSIKGKVQVGGTI